MSLGWFMLDTIILRFRDHGVESTIEEHISCIKKFGFTVWGWWKKETEPNRSKEINMISSLLEQKEAGIDIALFDRATSSFFIAKLIKTYGGDSKFCLSPEPQSTPAYYREEKLPLWIKISSIEAITQEKFEEKFGGIPKGEHTFFPFLYSKLGNFDSGVSKPETVKLPHNRIVQFSDIHFGSDFGFPDKASPGKVTLFDRVEYELKNSYDSEIGLFVISGDLTSRAEHDALIGPALDFLNKLSEKFSVPKERFVIIPGNHDISLSNYSETNYHHEKMFEIFLKEFYGQETSITGTNSFQTTSNREVQFLRMNSVRLRKKSEAAFGYVDWSLYEGFLEDLEYNPDSLRIATMHHHLVSMESETIVDTDYPYANFSTTIDAGNVINGLQTSNFDLVLHGHQHIPGITKICRGQINNSAEIDNLSKDLIAISSGSAGVKSDRLQDDFRDNSFNVIEINDDSTVVTSNSYNSGRPARRYFSCDIPRSKADLE